jgi:hypothetical protein
VNNLMDAKTATNDDILRQAYRLSQRGYMDNIPVACESGLEAAQRHRSFIDFLINSDKTATGFGNRWVEVAGITVSFVVRLKADYASQDLTDTA